MQEIKSSLAILLFVLSAGMFLILLVGREGQERKTPVVITTVGATKISQPMPVQDDHRYYYRSAAAPEGNLWAVAGGDYLDGSVDVHAYLCQRGSEKAIELPLPEGWRPFRHIGGLVFSQDGKELGVSLAAAKKRVLIVSWEMDALQGKVEFWQEMQYFIDDAATLPPYLKWYGSVPDDAGPEVTVSADRIAISGVAGAWRR